VGILPSTGKSLTFGYGHPACTKELPPCAAAVPFVEVPDLHPDERFCSTYASAFQGLAPDRPASRGLGEQFPRRYVPAEGSYSARGIVLGQHGWHVRRPD